VRAALAIAWNLVLETTRRRSALVFLLLFSGFAVALPFSLEGEGTLRSRLQAAVTYGAGLPVFAISLATVFLSSGAISLDIERRRLHGVVTKPVRRLAILGGKLLGIIAIDAVLLAAILAAVSLHAALGGGAGAGSDEHGEAEDRFFQVRRSVRPTARTPTAEEVRRLVESLSANDAHGHAGPVDLESAAKRSLSIHRIEPGSSTEIRFEGIGPCPPGSRIFIRYALFASPPAEAGRIPCEWTAAVRGGEALRIAPPAEPPGIPREIAVPSDLVEEGVLRLSLASPVRSGLTIFADPERIEALPVEGGFWSNAGLGFTAVLGPLVLLAAIGLLAGSLFGFPTACLLTGFIYCVGVGSSFLGEVFTEYSSGAGSTVPEAIGRAASGVGLVILDVLPDFAGIDPIVKIADGRAIPLAELAAALAWTAGLQAFLALAVAALVLGRKEIERGGSEA
jgi:hypothetical protein